MNQTFSITSEVVASNFTEQTHLGAHENTGRIGIYTRWLKTLGHLAGLFTRSDSLKVYSNELFLISTNERLMYKFYKNCNYFIFK